MRDGGEMGGYRRLHRTRSWYLIDNSGAGYFWREILVDKKIEHLSFVSHGPAFLAGIPFAI